MVRNRNEPFPVLQSFEEGGRGQEKDIGYPSIAKVMVHRMFDGWNDVRITCVSIKKRLLFGSLFFCIKGL